MKKTIQYLSTPEGRKMAKEAFRKGFQTFKSAKARFKRNPSQSPPVIPYKMIKADVKRKIRGTKLTTSAEIKATPGLRRRMIVRIEKAKKDKPKFKGPIVGKAYASDKRAKRTMMITTPKKERQAIQKSISDSVRAFMKKKTGFKKGKFI